LIRRGAKGTRSIVETHGEGTPLKLAAIDIGSNSIKLVVVETVDNESFMMLEQQREVVRLGHETLAKGYLGAEAILRATDCIDRFCSSAKARGAETIAIIATASVRAASNSAEFISAVEEKTGVRVEVLSGVEEARLIGLAAAHACTPRDVTSLNIDIGGGSTEISIFRDHTPLMLRSMKLGAVGLTERFLKSDPASAQELEALRSEIRSELQTSASELREQKWDYVTATSGTALAVGAALRSYADSHGHKEIRTTEGAAVVVALPEIARLNAWLSAMSTNERRTVAGLSPQRADIIVAGGFVLEEVMSALGIDSLHTCDWALREGVIVDRLRAMQGSATGVSSVPGEKIDSVS
jgi:exopolyphosphatase / guanosine-5'-triphosphate,3'-diphosphate pyrophosphatase